jgi:putative peptidoglycan lipid II flippase
MAGLLKSTNVVGGMTMVSRVFGLVRDVVLARYFGAGLGVDVFIVAFRIPNFLRRLFAEGGFSQAFVPVLSEYREKRGDAAVQALIDQTGASLGAALLVITAAGVIGAPVLIAVFAPGFIGDSGKYTLAVDMLRITFPYILFISLTAFAGAILNTYRKFAVPAFTPVLLNLSLIACAIWLAPLFPEGRQVVALAWGVFIAGVAQLLFQYPFLYRLGRMPRPGLHRDREGVARILTLMLPTLFAVSVTQINLLIDTLIASFLQTGSISWLYYSDRIVELPVGVFGAALATVILPNLSSEHAKGGREGYSRIMSWSIGMVLLVSLPAAAGLILLASPILTTLFQYAEFTPGDVMMAGRSLIAYAVGLPAFILIKVLASGFFSKQDTRTPVKIAVVAMLSNIVLNLLLVVPLAHAGLALATSLSAYINAGLLYYTLKKTGHYVPAASMPGLLLRTAAGLAVMAMMLGYFSPAAAVWFSWDVYQRVARLALWIGAGMMVYLVTLWLCGLRRSHLSSPS